MARLRRSAGVQRTGALIINGRKRRSAKRKTSARKPAARRRTTAARRRSRAKKNPSYRKAGSLLIKNGRKRAASSRKRSTADRRRRPATRRRSSARKNPSYRKAGSLLIKNGRKKSAASKRKKAPRVMVRRNGRDFTLPFTDQLSKSVGEIPFIGKGLAEAIALATPAALGAVSVIPTTFAAQALGPVFPRMNSSLFYAVTGVGLATLIGSTQFLGRDFHRALAIAVAAGSGAIALYKWQTGTDAPMATETGRLLINSPLAGLGTLIVGGKKLGSAHMHGYGPSAVRPMQTFPPSY